MSSPIFFAYSIGLSKGAWKWLGLIEDVVDFLHHLVPDFHPHADIDNARLVIHAVFLAHGIQPVRAAAPRGHHNVLSADFSSSARKNGALTDATVHNEIDGVRIEYYFDAAVEQAIFDSQIDLLRLFRA